MAMGTKASDSFDLRDVASGLSVTVTLRNTNNATVEVSSGYLVYPAAYEGGADVLQRPYPSGTEQSLSFASRPTAEQITYDVALGQGVAGIRLVSNTVEFLDAHGAPRLRMAPPYISGSQSTSAWATVTVQGCAVDVSPSPPWNRAVTPPGGTHCAVSVDWSKDGIQYPALLDPSWSVGSTMSVARMHHGSARVTASGKELALVFGGYAFTSTIGSAELFDESSGTWATTGSLVADVSYAPGVALSSGAALAVGGFRISSSGGIEYDGVQAYSPTSGTWSLQGHLGSAREEHTASLLSTGNVLVVGGFGTYPQVFASALLYNPSTGTATSAGTMQSARGDHSATLLSSGKVLVVDGMGAGGAAVSAADLYDPGSNAWSVVPAPPIPARFSHTAPLLPSGKVLMAGGEDLNAGIAQTRSTAIYDPTANTWSAGPSTVSSHYLGTATVLTQGNSSGKVVLAGGDFALDGVELFDPTALAWKPIAPLLTGRDGHVAVLLQSGLLLAGGSDSNGNLLSSGELYQADVAATAPQWPSNSTLTVSAQGTSTAVTLNWSAATDANGVSGYAVYENGQLLTTVSGSTLTDTVTGLAPGTTANFAVQAVDPSGAPTWTGPTATYLVVPPSAASVASPIDRTVSTTVATNTSFLYSGPNPIQRGVDAGTVVAATAAVVRGHVYGGSGAGLPGVSVVIAGHPELGSTYTQADGEYDLAVNGGQVLRLQFARSGYLPAERIVTAPWQDYVTADDVILMTTDPQVTSVTMSSSTTGIQVARGSASTDTDGTRQATVLVPPATTATMTMPGGGTTPLTTMSVRATEFTVGSNGPKAMPAALPPTSAYTYAVGLTADEALSQGATQVTFSQPVPFYVENFLGLPVGTAVPAGYYDPSQGAWVPSPLPPPNNNGIVLQILSVSGGQATVDLTGSGTAATASALSAIGITTAELQQLAALYAAGQSLWRVLIPHFSVWDMNWGWGPPSNAGPPPGLAPVGANPGAGPGGCEQAGSIIECQRQSLGQEIPIAGVPYSLRYDSDRQAGRTNSIGIPLSGPTLPGPLNEIDLEVDVAGRVFTQSFRPPQPNMSTTFTWDGNDAYGRHLQGSQPVTVRVGNTYDGLYEKTAAFGYDGNGIPITASQTREQSTLWSITNTTLGVSDKKPLGLGGWSLDVHHVYDPGAHTIYFGDGTELTPANVPGVGIGVIQTIAGGNNSACSSAPYGDNGPATSACLSQPRAVAIGPDGSVYIGDSSHFTVRRVAPDGTIHLVAGSSPGFGGDEGFATSAKLSSVYDLALGPDGTLYIADAGNNRIRHIDSAGKIHTVAGSGATGETNGSFSGDGNPATQATLHFPTGVDVASDGTIYIADSENGRIRRVGPDGIISTVAGTGVNCNGSGNGALYGHAATGLNLDNPLKVRVSNDGSFYIDEWHGDGACGWVIDRVSPNGIITIYAGQLNGGSYTDGVPATSVAFQFPDDIALGRDNSLYILTNDTAMRVNPAGIINTVAGRAGQNGSAGANGPATAATIAGQNGGLRVGPDDSLYLADEVDNIIRRIEPALPGFNPGSGNLQFPSQDGKQIYVFDNTGRHLETVDAFTGATLYAFNYDAAGRLFQVADVSNNVTTINHDANGNPTSIVSPYGQTTSLAVDSNGYLASITDPASQKTQFTYTAQGLMTAMTDTRGGPHAFSYDGAGRLQQDQDPAGGSKTLVHSDVSGGFGVAITTGLGRQSTYQTTMSNTGTFSRQNTLPDGTQSSLQFASNGVMSVTAADGTTTSTTESADPRFGVLAPLAATTTTTPSGLTSKRTTTRSVTSSNGSLATWTEQTSLNGNNWQRVFNVSNSTWTTTSPVGRTTTVTVDSADRPTQIAVPGIGGSGTISVNLAYDANGRLHTTTQGSSSWTNGYDTNGYLSSITDPLSHAISYTNDLVGRPTQTQLADSRLLAETYDGDSNATSVTLPSSEVHNFSFTPVDLLASYQPPSVSSASPTTQYVYDVDRELKTVTRPDGVTLSYAYDSAGRLQTTTIPQGTITRTYNSSTGHLQSSTAPSQEAIAYSFDGFLKTGETSSGPVAGSLTLGFDNNFRMTSQTVNGTALSFGYDNDGLLTSAGAITMINRDPHNGLLTGTTLGSMTDAYTYDANGLFKSYTASYSGNALYSESVLRYADNRIKQKTETIGSTTHVWGYSYDATGRLTDVTEDGNFFSHYGYDPDDNRTTYHNTSGTLSPSYDAQDRLTAYGSTTYAYTLDGELSSKTVSGQTTSYTYDPLGNLLHVGPPSGSAIDYVVDSENRRVGKKLGGTLTTGFLYQDALNVVAQLDGSGNLVARYVFGSKPNVPDYYTNSSGTFRILSDHLGSPRLIVNASTGAVVEEIDYDEFGNVTNDTAPGTIPYGFAGGLYDKDTGLVRFGARDYDASVGRWTSKDPRRFGGHQINVYDYVGNDPLNGRDPFGLDGCTAIFGIDGLLVCALCSAVPGAELSATCGVACGGLFLAAVEFQWVCGPKPRRPPPSGPGPTCDMPKDFSGGPFPGDPFPCDTANASCL
jgi:RHS repeat-associated protein